MHIEKAGARLVFIVLGLVVAACATVADLEVSRGKPDAVDLDDPNAAPDAKADRAAASETGGPLPSDAGLDVADAFPAPPPSVCSCPAGDGCCAMTIGTPTCSAGSAATTCVASSGYFIRCSGGDVANGRVCCLSAGLDGTFYAASCADAGPQVCTDATECSKGTCEPTTCRGVALTTCRPMGEARTACP